MKRATQMAVRGPFAGHRSIAQSPIVSATLAHGLKRSPTGLDFAVITLASMAPTRARFYRSTVARGTLST
eukprot:5557875-Pyramimonas_sp.AAC.1